jgi:hypothetical protein
MHESVKKLKKGSDGWQKCFIIFGGPMCFFPSNVENHWFIKTIETAMMSNRHSVKSHQGQMGQFLNFDGILI